jgi:hypothetical protein
MLPGHEEVRAAVRTYFDYCNQHWLLEDLSGRHGGRKVVIAPSEAAARRNADPRSGAGARWKQMLGDGKFRSSGEIADAEGLLASSLIACCG